MLTELQTGKKKHSPWSGVATLDNDLQIPDAQHGSGKFSWPSTYIDSRLE